MITFPSSPSNGQTFTAPSGVVYTWVAADLLWKAAQPVLLGGIGLPPLTITGAAVSVLATTHLGRMLVSYDVADMALTFPPTLPVGWECAVARMAAGNVLPVTSGSGLMIWPFSGQSMIAAPDTQIGVKVMSNADGLSANFLVSGATA